MAKLTTAARNALPASAFVFPKERRYPIHDAAHARDALSRASGTKDEAAVKAAVRKRYPTIQVGGEKPKSKSLLNTLMGR